ncbi:MAG: Ig-like domain-containing protein [Planctomycetota bacterium]
MTSSLRIRGSRRPTGDAAVQSSASTAFAFAAAALLLAACSGGGGSIGDDQLRCAAGGTFCLVSCDLGCGTSTCAVTGIAENQALRFQFNQPIARASVNAASLSLRTVTGELAEGSFVVDGAAVLFVPSAVATPAGVRFGFRRNETYAVTVVGGQGGIESVAGDLLPASFRCNVTATLGLIDIDAAPPQAELVTPQQLDDVPTDVAIALRFSELIDGVALQQGLHAGSPVQFLLRRTQLRPDGTFDCSIDAEPVPLAGQPRLGVEVRDGRPVSTLTLRPQPSLPGSACIEVRVSPDLRDLSGRGAVPASFFFRTRASTAPTVRLTEDFATAQLLDVEVSGGTWADGARPAQLGGDGRHGSFDHALGEARGGGVFEWNVDRFRIPASHALDGRDAVVDDGRFFFTDLHVPAGVTVRFTGGRPVQLFVRGRVRVEGRLEANGEDQVPFNCRNLGGVGAPLAGQPGTRGGPGGGRGGDGGDRCLGQGPQPTFDGDDGDDLVLAAGHAYAALAVGTGGRGAPMFPAHGRDSLLTGYIAAGQFNSHVGSGGGGGGHATAGGAARNVPPAVPVNQTLPTQPAAGGVRFDVLPVPAAIGADGGGHFLVGGAGGGGGGSHPFAALAFTTFDFERWKAGAGGAGGGGVMSIRAGRDLELAAGGAVQARGGRGARFDGDNPATAARDLINSPPGAHWGVPAPGGGGAGGSLVLRSGGDLTIRGVLDVGGGRGGFTEGILPNVGFASLAIDNRGGDGAPGFYRLESAGELLLDDGGPHVPAFDPLRHAASLVARDDVSGQRSKWIATGSAFPPQWLHYELAVDLDGDGAVDVVYSDDPERAGTVPADDPLGPVRIRFQGARPGPDGLPDPLTLRPWRPYVSASTGIGLHGDAATMYRFELLFQVGLFPAAVVRRLDLFVRQ